MIYILLFCLMSILFGIMSSARKPYIQESVTIDVNNRCST